MKSSKLKSQSSNLDGGSTESRPTQFGVPPSGGSGKWPESKLEYAGLGVPPSGGAATEPPEGGTPNLKAAIEITRCRISGSENLIPVLNLGRQCLTGVFPKAQSSKLKAQSEERGPVELVLCPDSGLVQLRHDYDLGQLYGDNYGYRSGLNASMVAHLRNKVAFLKRLRPMRAGDTVVDIGSNDGTLLKAYGDLPWAELANTRPPDCIGFDPVGGKFLEFYPKGVTLVPDFFKADGVPPAAIITSISMFYDLPDPKGFVREVARCLAPDGLWHFEQSYLPAMLRTGSYDTVVVEHLEYYTLGVVKRLLAEAGLRIVDVQTNDVNGGSFAVTACHSGAAYRSNTTLIEWMLRDEDSMGLMTTRPYRVFEDRALAHRDGLVALVRSLRAAGNRIIGCGASTKGNCLLQYCGFTAEDIEVVGDPNPDKWGCVTPGTHIPIVPEEEARALQPDYMLVPVWHFRPGIIAREAEFLARGGKLIFPFPHVEIVG